MDALSPPSDRLRVLAAACRAFGVAAVYLFGSRAEDGLRGLEGKPVERLGSDLDVGVLFRAGHDDVSCLAELQVALEDVFAPLRVDLVPLERVDALFQFRAIDGHRVWAQGDKAFVDRWELVVMRRASELLPIQRQIERDLFGVSTS